MNIVYQIVFNRSLKCFQFVSGKGRRRGAPSRLRPLGTTLTALSTAIALCGMTANAFAAAPSWNEWEGGIDTDWSNPGNWQLGEPTAMSSPAVIDSGGTAVVTRTGESASQIYIGDTGTGTLMIQSGGQLEIGADAFVGYALGSAGRINVDGPGSSFSVARDLHVGNAGDGAVAITGGASMSSADAHIGTEMGGTGAVEISGAGSAWTNSRELVVGYLGSGSLRVLDGAQVDVNGELFVGYGRFGTPIRAEVLISGAGSQLTQTGGPTYVGVYSDVDASFVVENQGAATLNAILGADVGSKGRVLVTGAGSSWNGSALTIGSAGNGRFEVTDGATAVISGSIGFGIHRGGSGSLRVGQDALLVVGGRDGGPGSIYSGLGQGGGRLEMDGGTLRSQGNLSVTVPMTVGVDSTLETDAEMAVSGTISGAGLLRKTGSGMLSLSGSNDWSGGLQVDRGSVSVGGSQALGSGVLAMADGTLLGLANGVVVSNQVALLGEVGVSVASGASATLGGSIHDGVLVKRDGGELVFNGTPFNGATRVEEGVLRAVNVLPSGDIHLGSAATFQLDTPSALDYSGQLSGTGTFRQGRSELTLRGDGSDFSGTFVVDGGRLVVDGTLGGQVSLSNEAHLGGNGTVGSAHLMSGSTLDPGGGAVGHLSLAGNLTFDTSARYRVDVAADGSSDRVNVAGIAALGGASSLAVAAAGDWQPTTRYTVLTAGNGVDGTFAGVTSDLAFLTPTLSYDANNVYLTMARNMASFPGLGLTGNQERAAVAVEALGYGSPVYDAVVRLASTDVVPAFDSLSGEVHAATRGALLQNRFLHDGIDLHLDGRATSSDLAPGLRAWVAGSGGQLRTDASAETAASRVQQNGLMAGAGWQVGESLELGVAAGQQQLDNRLRDRADSAETDATEYGVYAHYRRQGLSLRGGVTRADYRTDTTRTAQVGTAFSEQLLAREDATGTTAFVRVGWSFGGPRLLLTPEIELAQVRLKSDGSQERGGVSALRLASGDSEYRTGLAALKADWDISGGLQDRAVLSARVGWQHADGDRLPTTTARFVGGSQDFTIAGAPLARSNVLAQLGVAVSPGANSRVSLQVQGRDGDGQRDVGAQLDWSLAF